MKVSRMTKSVMIIAISTLLLTTMLSPSFSIQEKTPSTNRGEISQKSNAQTTSTGQNILLEKFSPTDQDELNEYIELDRYYYINEEDMATSNLAANQNDAGYNTDAGDKITRSFPLYPGEAADGAPGRGTSGTLDPDNRDTEDWYLFSVCEGQTIQVSLGSAQDYDYEILDSKGQPQGKDYTALETGRHFLQIFANEGTGTGDYALTVTLNGQNDAGSNNDAGDTSPAALPLTPGSYSGYMDMNDPEDWYSFSASAGQGIFITLEAPYKSDIDIHLYNPTGDMVHEALYYGDDELEYPADTSGTWKIQLDMFPGWDSTKWPQNYYLYGSGAYGLEVTIGGTAQTPPGPIPQPDIVPVAQTFTITNDPDSSKDEYCYLAAIPAANYVQDGTHFVSPIIYTGDTTATNWFGDVDDTTQYLLDDWTTYLGRHNLEPMVYTLDQDPVTAAATLATTKWASSDDAVIMVDGSSYQDEIEIVVNKDASLRVKADVITTAPDDLIEVAGYRATPLFIGPQWGVMTIYAVGNNAPAIGVITPRYEVGDEQDWPHPYDTPGDNTNIYFPVALPGMYFPYADGTSGSWNLQVTKYSGDRYKIPVQTTDSSLTVTVTTTDPSYLEVFLVDPLGNMRRPSIPHWNGGPINPIHVWNGGHWEGIGFEDWRRWEPTLSTEHMVEVHYPMTGKWTAIVAPHYPYGEEKSTDTIDYHITAELRKHSDDRVFSALSAANGAVIASQQHVPLLYVKEDQVPTVTSNALTSLGVENIIFVNINNIGKNVKSALGSYTLTDLNTGQKVVDYIKADMNTENFITITSLASGNGYFAPAAMIAAYHGGPVLSIGEAPEAYNALDEGATWREYGGCWYHGCNSLGHLPWMDEPFNAIEFIRGVLNGDVPDPGFDMKLRWYGTVHDEIKAMIDGYGLDGEGREAYMFVAPRDDDIRDMVNRAMNGNNSYAGQIPGETPAFASAHICRDILYPAIIYANPGRDVTSSCFFNFADGRDWTLNTGERIPAFTTRVFKEFMFSHGRFYEGHILWRNLLERYNEGASIIYHCSHGTGGSGICCMYENIAEQFPQAETQHEELHDFTWWDGWRGYMYDDLQTKTPRWGGFTWTNSQEPNLYDIVHFKWCDQLFDNLHSQWNIWQSCTTASHFGPMIYLEHGAALYWGNGGSAFTPVEEILDMYWLTDMMVHGKSIGESMADSAWLIQRDFTTQDPTAMYGRSSLQIYNVQMIFGDPTMVLYSPEWIEPIPVTV